MPKELLSKAEAAELLGCTQKSVERYVSRGKLTVHEWARPSSGGKPTPLFDRVDVEGLSASLNPNAAHSDRSEATPAPMVALAKRAFDKATLEDALSLWSHRSEPTLAELAHRTVLTLAEAGRLTGLGLAVIERAVTAGELTAKPIGPRGARVVARTAVEAFALAQLAPEPARRRRRR